MGSTDYGSQIIQFEYKDPLNAAEFNKRNVNIVDPGVYNGGLLSIVNDTTVTLATFTVEVADGTYSARCNTTTSVAVTVSTSNIYVIARWSYSAQVNWYVDILAVNYASLQPNDIIFGKCIYTGSTLTSIDYSEKTLPRLVSIGSLESMLKPSFVNGQMYIAVASGKFSYGSVHKSFAGGNSLTLTAPTVNPKIDLIYIDGSGVLQVTAGVEGASPSPPSHTGKVPIAEVYLEVGDTQIDSEDITDVRPWLNISASAGAATDRDDFIATASQTVFNLSFSYTPGIDEILVFSSGLLQTITVDYTESSGTQVTFVSGRILNEKVSVTQR